jgi:hypothetical protein
MGRGGDPSQSLHELGQRSFEEYQRSRDVRRLRESVELFQQVAEAGAAGEEEQPWRLANLGLALLSLARETKGPQDLNAALRVCAEAVRLVSASAPQRPAIMDLYAGALREQHLLTGDVSALRMAAEHVWEAVHSAGPEDPGRDRYLRNLGLILWTLGSETHDLDVLRQAVDVQRAIVAATPASHPDHPQRLRRLRQTIGLLYEETSDSAVLADLVQVDRDVLEGAPDSAELIEELLQSLWALYDHTHDPELLREAVRLAEEIVRLAPREDEDRPRAQAMLAQLLRQLATATGDRVTLAEAVRAGRTSMQGLPRDHLHYVDELIGFTGSLRRLYAVTGDVAVLEEAIQAGQQLVAALSGNERDEELDELSKDLRRLRESRAQAADAAPSRTAGVAKGPGAVLAGPDERRRRLARRWDELVEQARGLDGFGDFLRSRSLRSMLPAATGGPVVVVNMGSRRADAIILTPDGAEPLALPGLHSGITQWTNVYLIAVQKLQAAIEWYVETRARFAGGDRSPGVFHDLQAAKADLLETRAEAERAISDTLAWLWDCLAEPVLGHLGFGPSADPPRLWWCPTGPLTLLPLHAAGHHQERDGRTVIDRVVPSHTPTLRALQEARLRQERALAPEDRLLVVEVAQAPGQVPLPHAREEVALLEELFAGRCTVLREEAATRENVRSHLATHRRVHFSCHGMQDFTKPSDGGLLLHDGLLRIGDLTAERFGGDFAFLSACKAATGGLVLEDEAISLASTLHYTGFTHVIATLWSVYDTTAREVARRVYERLSTANGLAPERAAHALNETLRELRDQQPESPTVWLPFTHLGP